jgi:hypothetical protein
MVSLELEGASIVVLGSFNPAIFQPRWLGAQGLLRPEEVENATVKLIQNDFAEFTTEWLHLQVMPERFAAHVSSAAQLPLLREFVVNVLELLPHTPVTAVGLNRMFDYSAGSNAAWHTIGHRLAPKEPWLGFLSSPGMRELAMEGRRPDAIDGGVIQLKVKPSPKVKYGVNIDLNEEFRKRETDGDGTRWVIDRILTHWEDVMRYAESAAINIMSLRSGL